MKRFVPASLNGFTFALTGLVGFGFLGCGVDYLAGRDMILTRAPGSDLANVDGATYLGRLLLLLWSALWFGVGMHRFYVKNMIPRSE